jgi:uncharacterized protein (DUF302 family)
MHRIMVIFLALLVGGGAGPALADLAGREGWQVIETDMSHAVLLERLLATVPEEGMAVVTQAGPTAAAQTRGIEIPENRVVGVFNNEFAVRILDLSTAAMIEAPIRFYVTEDADGSATLSWKEPSFVLAPYADTGGADLIAIAGELDQRFASIAARATGD